MLDEFPSATGGRREPVRDQLRRLYYDIAVPSHPGALRLAAEVVGTDRLLYGSDIPFAPNKFIDANAAAFSQPVDGTDLVAATRDNAQRRFA